MDIKLTQMEFDFMNDSPEPAKPEDPAIYLVELTMGWDGNTVRQGTVTGVYADACNMLKTFAHEIKNDYTLRYRDAWTTTAVDKPYKHTVCDFGSWTYFGRITRK